MIIQSAWQLSFDFFGEKPVVGEPSDEQSSSGAGPLDDAARGERTVFESSLARPTAATRWQRRAAVASLGTGYGARRRVALRINRQHAMKRPQISP